MIVSKNKLFLWTTENTKLSKTGQKSDGTYRINLSDAHFKNVREFATAKNMWTNIFGIFEQHTLHNNLAARRNIYTVSMHDREKSFELL